MFKLNSTSFFAMICIILVLCLLGTYGLISLHAKNISNILKENINLIVELTPTHSDIERENVMRKLQENEKIIRSSVRYISADQAVEIMNEEMSGEVLINPSDNPLSEIILFNVSYEYVSQDELKIIKEELEQMAYIQSIQYYESVYDYLGSNVKRLSRLLLYAGILLSLFAFGFIYGTIQLSMETEKFKIRTMELVGAEYFQIRKPFIVQALRIAILSSLIAIAILIILLIVTALEFSHFYKVINYFYVFMVFFILIVFAISITQWATYIVVQRYLGADKSSFYK
jgi:cell division transport system permease protein